MSQKAEQNYPREPALCRRLAPTNVRSLPDSELVRCYNELKAQMDLHWEHFNVPHSLQSPFGEAFANFRSKGDELLNALSMEMLNRGVSPNANAIQDWAVKAGADSHPKPIEARKTANKAITGSLGKKPRGQSLFTRAVKKALVNAPRANGSEICLSVDEDGVPPSEHIKRSRYDCYEDAYKGNQKIRRQLDSRIAKIRKEMRSNGLLS